MAETRSSWRWTAVVWIAGALLLTLTLAMGFFLYPVGGFLALVPLAFVFLLAFPLGFVQATPENVLAYLAHEFRKSAHVVALSGEELTVRLGRWSSVKIRATAEGNGSVLTYRTSGTATGWGVLVILLLFLGPFAIIVALAMFHRVVMAMAGGATHLVPGGRVPETFRPDDLRVLLLASLGEGHRLALESYEVERENYHDALLLVAVGVLFGWFVSFLFLFAIQDAPWADTTNRLLIAAAAALAFGGITTVLVRRRYLPILAKYREWVSRLETAQRGEFSRERSEADAPSTFDVLYQASAEVPRWIATQRRAGLKRDPAKLVVILLAVMEGIQLTAFGVPFLFATQDHAIAAAFVAIGVSLIVGGALLYRHWRRERASKLAELQASWNRQYDSLRGRMEQFLQDL